MSQCHVAVSIQEYVIAVNIAYQGGKVIACTHRPDI
jgi:hypothetical protein